MSLAVSGVLYALLRSLPVSLWVFAGGTLIDLDHLYDYHRYPHRPDHRRFDRRHFLDTCHHGRLQRVFIPLHSWEVTAALLVAGRLLPEWGVWMVPLAFGMGVHLLLDAFFNDTSVSGYSLAARWAHRFDGGFFYVKRPGTRGRGGARPDSPGRDDGGKRGLAGQSGVEGPDARVTRGSDPSRSAPGGGSGA